MKYRIVEVREYPYDTIFIPQRRFLFWWLNITLEQMLNLGFSLTHPNVRWIGNGVYSLLEAKDIIYCYNSAKSAVKTKIIHGPKDYANI